MVSTRQMSIGNNGTGEGSEHTCTENGPAKYTRNSTAAAHSSQGQCSKCTTTAPAKPHFLDLPQEIIEKIFSYLTYKNICQLRFVSISNYLSYFYCKYLAPTYSFPYFIHIFYLLYMPYKVFFVLGLGTQI